ncbi:MAG: hypothetical protein C4535_16645 [Comamonadaceae bacterium]|nr:MAG: hypothetical protein C4535_16645 [Comamonadaceae bacterium]
MSAVMEVSEPSADSLNDLQPPLVQHFELMATAPGGVTRLRELILTLAVQGKLVPQDPTDELASELLRKIRTEKSLSIGGGKNKRGDSPAAILEEDFPYTLPMTWEWIRNQDLFSLRKGKNPKALSETPIGKPYLDIEALDRHQVRRYSEDATALTCSADDILVVCDGSRSGLILQGKDGIVGSTLAVIECSKLVQPYLRLIFREGFQRYNSGMKGAAIPHLDTKTVLTEVIGLPPLAEQTRIVTRVEELMSLCDALEAQGQLEATQHAQLVQTLLGALTASASPDELADNWQRVATHFDLLLDRPEAIDALEQTILQLAVRGLLSPPLPEDQQVVVGSREDSPVPLPAAWSYVRLGGVLADLRYGTAVKCAYDMVGHPVLRIPNLKNGSIDATDLKFGQLGTDDLAKLALKRGDVLIVRSNGSASLVGSMAVVGPESEGFAFAGYLVRARLNPALLTPEYLNLAAKTAAFREQIEGPIRTTSGVKNINSSEISRLSFALPPLGQQQHIVARVDSLRRLCADLRQRLTARQTTQAHLAEALIDEVA